jgi:hypothetical protein
MRWKRIAVAGVALAAGVLWLAYQVSWGLLGKRQGPGEIRAEAVPTQIVFRREAARGARAAALGVPRGRQILFGDLHVHTTFSTDAFASSLPIFGGTGAHPPADACDFARYCSGLDFWSINDHASNLTPEHWRETQQSIRECNARSGDPERPDLVSFLGWEWTQVGQTPATHYGHKNVVLLETASDLVPRRPIAEPIALAVGGAAGPGALALLDLERSPTPYFDFARYMRDRSEVPDCKDDIHTLELPEQCREIAATPAALFRKLREWGGDSIVIPHGTSWGFYTPLGSSWDKQLGTDQDDPELQTLFEVYSGHGNAEGYRDWRSVETAADGSAQCPAPRPDYLPSCWRAGEIMRERCSAAGEDADTCEQRAALTRQRYVDIGTRGFQVVPGQRPDDWLDAGQCRDCFLPAFNHRPGNSAQYATAISHFDETDDATEARTTTSNKRPARTRFGFIAASDGHQAKPGIGYKQLNRNFFVDGLKFETPEALDTVLGRGGDRSASRPLEADNFGGFGTFEMERTTSFLSAGGLTAVHASGRDRRSIWDGLKRREVYGTSGTKILLWFDLLNPPTPQAVNPDRSAPMGSELAMLETPRFRVRAAGSLVQRPGCPDYAMYALGPDRIGALCANECDYPGEKRRRIDRIEVVRIRPQQAPGEPVAPLIEDPWRSFDCPPDPSGCVVEFDDPTFARDSVYYVRALEEPTPIINAGGLRCTLDEQGECVSVDACHQNFETAPDDDCLSEGRERAWSSPIYIDYADSVGGSSVEPERGPQREANRAHRVSMVALPPIGQSGRAVIGAPD